MRLLTVVPAIVTLGLICNMAGAQTSAATNPADTTPPPYPASPDSLVVPPGPPAPDSPQAGAPQPGVLPPGTSQPNEPAPPPPPVFSSPPNAVPPASGGAYYAPQQPAPGKRMPPRYRYVAGTPLPEGYHLETRANRGLVVGGAATFGVPYLIGTFGTLSVLGDGNTGWLAIPIVGPWLTLANRRSNCGEIGEPAPGGFECFSDRAGNGLLIASGVLQAAGVAMIALGLSDTREYAVANYANLHITPVATAKGDYGLVISGTL